MGLEISGPHQGPLTHLRYKNQVVPADAGNSIRCSRVFPLLVCAATSSSTSSPPNHDGGRDREAGGGAPRPDRGAEAQRGEDLGRLLGSLVSMPGRGALGGEGFASVRFILCA